MIKIYKTTTRKDWPDLVKRPVLETKDLNKLIVDIFKKIKEEGDEALRFFTKKFDNVQLQELEISEEEWQTGIAKVPTNLKEAIQLANQNIARFHSAQAVKPKIITTTPGVECWQESRAIERIGIYIPGGTAPLFSTVLMLATPAKIAGCQEVILCTPPDENGQINPAILYAARLTGITRIFKIGGAQAIAALSIGTLSVPKVYKIFGPGNQYVTSAKTHAQQLGIGIDMPAGPSELLVLADETANPAFVASDLLSQAEHGTDSQVVCVSNKIEILQKIKTEIEKQLPLLPRKKIAQTALSFSKLVLIQSKEESIEFINEYAPEHFILCAKDEDFYLKNLKNAGSVFIGNYTPESAGDYASGTNHTLPTNQFAKNYSGVNLDAFVKKITFQKITQSGLKNIGNAIELMAAAEGLQAHKNAVSIRLKNNS